jgi:hypothetical protein
MELQEALVLPGGVPAFRHSIILLLKGVPPAHAGLGQSRQGQATKAAALPRKPQFIGIGHPVREKRPRLGEDDNITILKFFSARQGS